MRASPVKNAARSAAVLCLILGVVSTLAVHADRPPALSGQVRDTVGNLLSGVEILLVNPARAAKPIAVTRSDRDGRFSLAEIIPGSYQVAAVKEGYLTFVGGVNTLVQSSLDLVLHPAMAIDENAMPRDGSWALRLPRRAVLREIDAGPPRAPVNFESDAPSAQVLDATRLQIDQTFAVGAETADGDVDRPDVEASETRMILASSMGERGRIRVDGRRERATADQPTEMSAFGASQRDSAVNFNLSYETGPEDKLAVNAFYNQADYELSAATPTDAYALAQEHQTWGYDATWSRHVNAKSRFEVAVDYRDTAFIAFEGEPTPATFQQAAAGSEVGTRAAGAQGSYESAQYDRHELEVAVRAEMQRLPASVPVTVQTREAYPLDPLSGWNLHARASDTWTIAAPFSLVYGLECRQSLFAEDALLVIPRVGGSWRSDGWQLKAAVSYHAVTEWNDPEKDRLATFQPASRVGYEAEIEVPIVTGIHFAAGTVYSPIQSGYVGHVDGREDEHPLYVTDGNTALWQNRLAIVEERGPSRTFLELSHGRAEGTILPLLPFEGPFRFDPGRSLQYGNGRLGVYLPARGTDLSLEYRRVESRGPKPAGESESVQESIELRARKAVSVFRVPGDWRLLMALRLGSVETADPEYRASRRGGDSVDALNRRLSAGVSVVF